MNVFLQPKMIVVLVCGFLLTGPVLAQQTRPTRAAKLATLAMKAHNYGDSIVLRWNVDKGAYWLITNQRGYILDRIQYLPGRARPLHKRLTVAPMKPWPLDTMKKRLRRDDRYAAIAAQVLYGKTYRETVRDEAVALYKSYQEQQGKLLVAAMAAEFSSGAASALALRYVDRTFDRRAVRCIYRLWINNGPVPKPNDLRDTAVVIVAPWRIDSLSAPRMAAVVAGDSTLTLRWYTTHNTGTYAGYFIERSADGKVFRRLNAIPYVINRPDTLTPRATPIKLTNEAEYVDSIPANYRKFYYRIIGINSFGDLSPASRPFAGSGRDLTPPPPPTQLTKSVEDNKRVSLTWAASRPAADLKGFVVARAADTNGPYQPVTKTLLPPTTRTFVDEKPVAYTGRYYVVAAVDTAGNLAYSTPIMATIADKTPPAPPRGLRADVDTNGIARLHWPPNTEPDGIGYKVFRAYQRNDKFYQQLTPVVLVDTMFTDTLPTNSLTRQAFYKIVAIDLTNNHSDFSEPIAVVIPDKIPPTTPVIRTVSVTERGVRLVIVPSFSDDIVEHVVYRQQDKQPWQVIKRVVGRPQAEVVVFDSSAVHQTAYAYSVVARDAGGHLSARSFVVPISYVDLKQLMAPAPTDLRATYDPQQKGIRLDWKSATPAERFIVYRGLDNELPTLYRAIGNVTTFTDQDLPKSGIYTYAVQLVTTGRKSVPSKPTQTVYKP